MSYPYLGKNEPQVSNVRITAIREMPTPRDVIDTYPNETAQLVAATRTAIHDILHGNDDRLLVVVGPCSVHDVDAALEYAEKLHAQATRFADDLLIVMRVYFEKPRTTIGWKGLINDPKLDGTLDINLGLRTGRELLCRINALGVPCGSEFLDTVIPQYIGDQVSWGAIGARTTESQIHRQLASGLSCPVGFKNGTDGNVNVCTAAVLAARQPHRFLAVTLDGVCALASSTGNEDTHVILRGGTTGPNYAKESVANAVTTLEQAGLAPRLMVDCSHANSSKDYRNQPKVVAEICMQIADGGSHIIGMMIESNLVAGKQDYVQGEKLVYGQSITDGCIGWEETVSALEQIAQAVAQRRS